MTHRFHLFPFRTQKLSYVVPKILGGKLPGKIGRCRLIYSSLAQSVERAAVNRNVVRSSRTGGAKPYSVCCKAFFDVLTLVLANVEFYVENLKGAVLSYSALLRVIGF